MFAARWLPILRFTAALLAGANEMPWRRFLLWNSLGGVCWVVSVGTLAYVVGSQAQGAVAAIGLLGLVMLVLAILGHLIWRILLQPRLSPDAS